MKLLSGTDFYLNFVNPFETLKYLFRTLVEDSQDPNPLNAEKLKRMKKDCQREIIHFMKTDLYFLVCPVRLAVIVFYNTILKSLPNVSASQLKARLAGLGLQLGEWFEENRNLLRLPRFRMTAFSIQRHSLAFLKLKKFLGNLFFVGGL